MMLLKKIFASKIAAITLAAIFCVTTSGVAYAGLSKEHQLKVAYLYHFTKFVKWPTTAFSDNNANFQLCIIGDDPFGKLLSVLSKKKVKKRRITIRRLDDVKSVADCHILFVSRSEASNLQSIFTGVIGSPVLTVGEIDSFVQHGGMVNFTTREQKLRFEISQERAEDAGLKISATMLQVGINVQ
ncbi:MAG: YfiR family protein [Magnetococcales bacterium]|nr:YfiR family protein [Magnetococcales bacterium]